MKNIHLVLLSLLMILVGCSQYRAIKPNHSVKVADFSFTTQDEETLSLKDFEGKWWIANFIFTNCEDVCMPMTYHMSLLQDKLKEHNLDVHLVSFSVDPEYDHPKILKEYGSYYEADFSTWSFLTGYDFQTIKELSIKSFRSLLQAPEPGSNQVLHGTAFMLVSPEGRMIKTYDGLSTQEMDVIIEDLNTLKSKDKF